MNIPNLISIFRIVLVPIYVWAFYTPKLSNNLLVSGIIFLIAQASDAVDGYIARRYNLETKIGAILDPLADKLLSLTVLITFTSKGLIPIYITAIIITKELIMIVGSSLLYLKYRKAHITAVLLGKAATVLMFITIMSIVFGLSQVLIDSLLLITLVFHILAFIKYMGMFLSKVRVFNNDVDKE